MFEQTDFQLSNKQINPNNGIDCFGKSNILCTRIIQYYYHYYHRTSIIHRRLIE